MDLAHSPVHLSHGPDPLSKPYCLPEAAQKARPLYFLSGRLLVFILGIILCFLVALTSKVSG